MRKSLALAAFLAAATPAMAQMVASPGMPMGMAMTSAQFRQMAMMSDAFEIESSRLALERSRSPAVQRFADQMITDHQAVSAALNGGTPMAGGALGGAATGALVGAVVAGPVGAAVGAGVGATTGVAGAGAQAARYNAGGMIDARQADMLNQLASTSGTRFDRLYGRMQVAAHQEAVAMYSAYAQTGTDPSLRNFAAQVLPTLEMHLAMARRLPR